MKTKKVFSFILILFFILLFALPSTQQNISGQSTFILNPSETTIGIISDIDGFSKNNISSNILRSLIILKKEFSSSILMYTPQSVENFSSTLDKAVNDGCDIVIVSTPKCKDYLINAASMYTSTFFIGVDIFLDDISLKPFVGDFKLNNLAIILYKEEEAGFLVGIVSGLLTNKFYSVSNKLNPENILGIIIGEQKDSLKRYSFGYKLGILTVNPDCKIIESITNTSDDLYLIRKYTNQLYEQKVDIVFQLCEQGGPAAIQAALLRDSLIIGYEIDQNFYAPDNILTSAIKKIESSIYHFLSDGFTSGFKSGIFRLGIKDGAIGLASFYSYDLIIPEQVKDAIFTAATAIIDGKLTIPFISITLDQNQVYDSTTLQLDNSQTINDNQTQTTVSTSNDSLDSTDISTTTDSNENSTEENSNPGDSDNTSSDQVEENDN